MKGPHLSACLVIKKGKEPHSKKIMNKYNNFIVTYFLPSQ